MAVLRRTGLIRSLTGAAANLARSVATQVTVSATTAVIIGLTGTAWLNRDAASGTSAASPPPVIVLAPAPAFAPRSGGVAVVPVSSFAWGGVDSAVAHTPGGFPMEEEARFGLSLSRPYKVTAEANWSSQDVAASGEDATRASSQLDAQSQTGKRRMMAETAELHEASPAPTVLPPSRPLDLTAYALPGTLPGPAVAPPAAEREPLRFTVLPEKLLPDPIEMAGRVVTQADAARAALLKTVSWAAGSVTSALPGN